MPGLHSGYQKKRATVTKARWAESAGGLCLERLNPPDHWCDPNEWSIAAFIYQKNREYALQLHNGMGGPYEDFKRYRTLDAAKKDALRLTHLEIEEEEKVGK